MFTLKELTSKSIVNSLNNECINSLLESYRQKYTIYSAYAVYLKNQKLNTLAYYNFLGLLSSENYEKCNELIHKEQFQGLQEGLEIVPFIVPHVLSPKFPIDKIYVIREYCNRQYAIVTNDVDVLRHYVENISDIVDLHNPQQVLDPTIPLDRNMFLHDVIHC